MVFVEGDAEADLYLPACDLDVFDDEAHEPLSLFEIEAAENVAGSWGEGGGALAEAVVGGQFAALLGQSATAAVDVVSSGVVLFGPSLEVDELDEAGPGRGR